MEVPDKNIFIDLHHNYAWTKKNYPEFYEWLMSKYNGVPFAGAIQLWINGEENIPVCLTCGTPVQYISRKTGFRKYCSKECMQKNPEWVKNVQKNGSPFSRPEVREKSRKTCLERYGVDHITKTKDFQEKIKKTCLEKYGVDNVFKLDSIQEKCHENFEKTIQKRKQKQYEELPFIEPDWDKIKCRGLSEAGIKKHYLKFYEYINGLFPKDMYWHEKIWRYRHNEYNEIKCQNCGKIIKFDKLNRDFPKYCSIKCANSDQKKKDITKQTCLKKYGVESPSSLPEVKSKIKQTNLEKYGVENPSSLPEVKDKRKQTCLKKYGVEHYTQLELAKERIKQTNLEKYGVGSYLQITQNYRGSKSKPNNNFAKVLDKNNIEYKREFHIEDRSYDFKINDLLIEINPSITHNSTFNPWSTPKSKDYHFNKSKLAHKNNFECICIWDWDDYDKIINHIITSKNSIGARKCTVKEVPNNEALEFLNLYHLQGKIKNIKCTIGLYYNNELISLMSFGKPRYNKKYEWEILRYCVKSNYIVSGGAQRILNEFKDKFKPTSIISYCDLSKFSGKIYESLGFHLMGENISKHWYNLKTKKHITDNFLRQRGFDQIFGTNYGKGTSNEELMKTHGFVEIWDCGQATYSWRNNAKIPLSNK